VACPRGDMHQDIKAPGTWYLVSTPVQSVTRQYLRWRKTHRHETKGRKSQKDDDKTIHAVPANLHSVPKGKGPTPLQTFSNFVLNKVKRTHVACACIPCRGEDWTGLRYLLDSAAGVPTTGILTWHTWPTWSLPCRRALRSCTCNTRYDGHCAVRGACVIVEVQALYK